MALKSISTTKTTWHRSLLARSPLPAIRVGAAVLTSGCLEWKEKMLMCSFRVKGEKKGGGGGIREIQIKYTRTPCINEGGGETSKRVNDEGFEASM